jgi:hypothetical protein
MSPSPPPGVVQAHDQGDAPVIRFTGRQVMLDEPNASRVGEQLLALAEGRPAGR